MAENTDEKRLVKVRTRESRADRILEAIEALDARLDWHTEQKLKILATIAVLNKAHGRLGRDEL